MPNDEGGAGHAMSGGGGWRGGNGGPWGQGPSSGGSGGGGGAPRGGGGGAPDLEELLRRSQDRLRRVLPGGGGSGGRLNPLALVLIAIVAVAILGYSFFTFQVGASEIGVVLRFGEVNRQVGPGLNFRLPYPVESVQTPQVTSVNQLTIGQGQTVGGVQRDSLAESLMLTGDENIVDIDFSVFWRIDPALVSNYLFNLQNPDSTVRDVAESAMRQVVGASNLEPLLTQARQITEAAVFDLIQSTLNSYGAGILITQVQLLKVDPPAEVIGAFRDVQAAVADAETLGNEATATANQLVPAARGTAAAIVQAATGDRDRTIAEAQGQANAFLQVYAAYAEAPAVIRERIYIETLAGIMADTNKVILDDSAGGVVPYLPLNQLQPRSVQ